MSRSIFSKRISRWLLALTLTLPAWVAPVSAHVGSPDVFFEGDAGPSHVIVTIRPPMVIPGVADIEVRVTRGMPSQVLLLPKPLVGPGARFAPTPDVAMRSTDDPQLFTGRLWIMATGSWQVVVRAEGPSGSGEVAIPVPGLALGISRMQRLTGAGLLAMVAILGLGFVSIVGAALREADVDPGLAPPPARIRVGRVAMSVAAVAIVILVVLANLWWSVEARAYSRIVYKPLVLEAATSPRFSVRLVDPGWLSFRRVDDLIPDHGKLMHLFAIEESSGALWHLHPRRINPGTFEPAARPAQAGAYRLFADVVHEHGLAETATGRIEFADDVSGDPLSEDDSVGRPAAELSDARVVRLDPDTPLRARRTTILRFEVLDPKGEPVRDLELYLGMPGHAVVVKRDWSVFAHLHSGGSVPMASLALTGQSPAGAPESTHALHTVPAGPARENNALPSIVSFPYGFPSPGEYRVYVQVKRGGTVQTSMFDLRVGL